MLAFYILFLCGISFSYGNLNCGKKCNPVGTRECSLGKCACKSGFEGPRCGSCATGHFGSNCQPVAECCKNELAKIVDIERRVRRDVFAGFVDTTLDENVVMKELDEIRVRLEKLWHDVAKAPFADDLHMYMADITQRISKLIEMINELTPMFTDDIESTYWKWNQTTLGNVTELTFNTTKVETHRGNLTVSVDILTQTRNALLNLTGIEKDIRHTIHNMNQIGIELERNHSEVLGASKDFETDEVVQLKHDLVESLSEFHNEIERQFFEKGGKVPLYDDPEALQKNLTETVLLSSMQLPHGWPSASSWFDEAGYIRKVIENATKNATKVLDDVDQYLKEVEAEIENLTQNIEEVAQWKDEVVDERNLIIYIDLLYSMAENFDDDVNTTQTNALQDLLGNITKIEKDIAELIDLGMNQHDDLAVPYTDHISIPTSLTITDEQIIEMRDTTKQLKKMRLNIVKRIDDATAKVKNAISKHDNVTEETAIVKNHTEEASHGFQRALDDLSSELDVPSGISGAVNDIMEDLDELDDKNNELINVDRDINEILHGIEQTTKELAGQNMKRKKRSRRHRNRARRHKKQKRQSPEKETPVAAKEVEAVIDDIENLVNEIEQYRNASTEHNWKYYLDFIQNEQNELKNNEVPELLESLCPDCETLQDYENKIESEMEELRSRAQKAMEGIRNCVKDPCWAKNLLSHDERPASCTENKGDLSP